MKTKIFLFGLALVIAIIIPTNGGPIAVAEANAEANPGAAAEANPEATAEANPKPIAKAFAEASKYKEELKDACTNVLVKVGEYILHRCRDHDFPHVLKGPSKKGKKS
ncbi:PREDICTED: uncharacterized protein LOC108772193 [Cyphomyrmex costatus]|uniref:uncharacterized protein LOC108772193 n=1 Tax=Cyphomyrmex costatus TaxID=456900 RepID=UPI000852311F|nr:PREDICTED: uncharacterized protein LOC108772193 [Cyphomyrmex costatus]